MITDDQLLRDRRSPAQLRQALLAPTILRMAQLRGLGRFVRVDDALAAIGKAQAKEAGASQEAENNT